MWGIFWGICWKSIFTWLLGCLAFLVIYGLFGNKDEDSFSYALLQLWGAIGEITGLLIFLSAIVLIIVSIWS